MKGGGGETVAVYRRSDYPKFREMGITIRTEQFILDFRTYQYTYLPIPDFGTTSFLERPPFTRKPSEDQLRDVEPVSLRDLFNQGTKGESIIYPYRWIHPFISPQIKSEEILRHPANSAAWSRRGI